MQQTEESIQWDGFFHFQLNRKAQSISPLSYFEQDLSVVSTYLLENLSVNSMTRLSLLSYSNSLRY